MPCLQRGTTTPLHLCVAAGAARRAGAVERSGPASGARPGARRRERAADAAPPDLRALRAAVDPSVGSARLGSRPLTVSPVQAALAARILAREARRLPGRRNNRDHPPAGPRQVSAQAPAAQQPAAAPVPTEACPLCGAPL